MTRKIQPINVPLTENILSSSIRPVNRHVNKNTAYLQISNKNNLTAEAIVIWYISETLIYF